MKKSIYLYFCLSVYLSVCLSVCLNGQILYRQEIGKGTSIERNTIFNLEEIKVRWKKAALENCPGVPCVTFSAPGPCSSIVATPLGPSSASVSFVPPTSDGGSPITGYTVTATSTPSAPAKRKTTSAIITVSGTSSPIVVTGLSLGINYIFTVLATNAVGPSPTITTTTTVTPCVLNTASAGSASPTLAVNTLLTNITHSTTLATGIGTATGLPSGVTASWSANVITISGTPAATGTFNYTIPLTGGCGIVNATGTITVAAACAAGAASSSPMLTVSTVMTNITHTTTIATGIGTATSLPAGVAAVWSAHVITISGTPTAAGTFNYTIPLTGISCSSVNATGTITVTTAMVPGAPTSVVATAGNTTASVAFVAPSSNGGSVITGYTVTSSPAGGTATGASSPLTVTGLTNGTAYTFTVVATNAVGNSAASAASAAVTPAAPFTCGISTVSDVDNNSYNTVLIGTQCWTKTNLRVRKYNDGTEIRFDASGTSTGGSSHTWSGTGLEYGAYSIHAHDSVSTPSNLTSYGYLYNWYASKGISTTGSTTYKNLCPTGYHVPTDSDWNKLVKFIDSGADTSSTNSTQSTTAGTKLKKNDALWATNTGTDDYGFSVLPGGYRNSDGSFYSIRDFAFFWSATEYDYSLAWNRYLGGNDGNVNRSGTNKSVGASVRCLRD
jgi:uncharacterized protein (TIGR02145 family)